MVGVKKIRGGVVGVLDDGTVLVCDEEVERRLRAEGVKVLRVGKITTS
jgi:hypothetical protein